MWAIDRIFGQFPTAMDLNVLELVGIRICTVSSLRQRQGCQQPCVRRGHSIHFMTQRAVASHLQVPVASSPWWINFGLVWRLSHVWRSWAIPSPRSGERDVLVLSDIHGVVVWMGWYTNCSRSCQAFNFQLNARRFKFLYGISEVLLFASLQDLVHFPMGFRTSSSTKSTLKGVDSSSRIRTDHRGSREAWLQPPAVGGQTLSGYGTEIGTSNKVMIMVQWWPSYCNLNLWLHFDLFCRC